MVYTKYGEFMHILRIKKHEVMGDVAKVLGVSIPFLLAVEIGEYSAVGNVENLQQGEDAGVEIYNGCIEISLKCIPEKISLEDGTVFMAK